jgi:hypothetical protein
LVFGKESVGLSQEEFIWQGKSTQKCHPEFYILLLLLLVRPRGKLTAIVLVSIDILAR